jgi:uncharacterized protein YjbI with pentapeptide repeats
MNTPSRTIEGQTLSRTDIAARVGEEPVRLVECELEGVTIGKLDLSGWVFERCRLGRTDFSGTTLELTQWSNCRGANAGFKGANIEDAVFRSSDFNNASFRSAVLASARFEDCKLTGADFTDARMLDVAFANTLLVSARLQGLDFRKQHLVGVDLSSADLANGDFRDATFEQCSLREANIEGARFENADLRGADLGGLDILGKPGRFRGAVVSAAQAELILSQTGIRVRAR